MKRYAALELADADRVVNIDEVSLASREGAEDWVDAVVEMRLGKTLSGRGILHAQQGRRASRSSTSTVGSPPRPARPFGDSPGATGPSRGLAEHATSRSPATPHPGPELRRSVVSGRVPRSPW